MIQKLPFWVRCILFLSVFVLLLQPIQRVVTNPYVSEAHVIEQMIADHDDFDVLIIGSSHSYCAFDPEILNSLLVNTHVYNMSSPNLGFSQISLLLEQLIEEEKVPEVLVLEMYSLEPRMEAHSQIAYFNAYSKTWSPGYLGQILKFYSPDEWLFPLFPLLYQHETWKLPTLPTSNILHFQNKEALTQKEVRNNVGYRNEGFRPIPLVVSSETYQESLAKPEDIPVTETNLTSFERILEISAENDIQLVFVVAPYPLGFNAENAVLDELSKKYGITIYNLNDKSIAEFSRLQILDDDHLNALGAVDASLLLANIIAEETDRDLHDQIFPYQNLNLTEIKTEQIDGNIHLTLVPENPAAQWDVEWHLSDAEGIKLREQGGELLSFTFPASLMRLPGLKLHISYVESGLDYQVNLSMTLTEE